MSGAGGQRKQMTQRTTGAVMLSQQPAIKNHGFEFWNRKQLKSCEKNISFYRNII